VAAHHKPTRRRAVFRTNRRSRLAQPVVVAEVHRPVARPHSLMNEGVSGKQPGSLAVILTLGTTETIAWASSYYLPAVLAKSIANRPRPIDDLCVRCADGCPDRIRLDRSACWPCHRHGRRPWRALHFQPRSRWRSDRSRLWSSGRSVLLRSGWCSGSVWVWASTMPRSRR